MRFLSAWLAQLVVFRQSVVLDPVVCYLIVYLAFDVLDEKLEELVAARDEWTDVLALRNSISRRLHIHHDHE